MGVYCINASRYLFQAEPEEVFAYAASKRDDSRFNDVSEISCALMRFAGDRLAEFTCSFGAADRSAYEVVGTEGVLKMDPAYEMVGDLKRELIRGGHSHKTKYKKRINSAQNSFIFQDACWTTPILSRWRGTAG
jgi:predicted dehydrogenase